MPLITDREEIQKGIEQLTQALYNHEKWFSALNRTLICRLTGNEDDMSPDAHRKCLFGQWYYGDNVSPSLREDAAFVTIGEEHMRMHGLCTQLLIQNNAGPIQTMEYDKFANALESLRLDISALTEKLKDALYTQDPLTGANTRTTLLPLLHEQQELMRREEKESCLALMDIDLFKDLNDKYGHAAGDLALVAITKYITQNIRPYDKLFRYGGEEFIILMQLVDMDFSLESVERLREGIAELDIDIGIGTPIRTTVSFGLTLLDPDRAVEESIERADKATYAAKDAGRNCIRVWEEISPATD